MVQELIRRRHLERRGLLNIKCSIHAHSDLSGCVSRGTQNREWYVVIYLLLRNQEIPYLNIGTGFM